MKLTKELAVLLEKLGWEDCDDISVEMAGTQVSGICLLYTSDAADEP